MLTEEENRTAVLPAAQQEEECGHAEAVETTQ